MFFVIPGLFWAKMSLASFSAMATTAVAIGGAITTGAFALGCKVGSRKKKSTWL
jgi:hypothetical protein